MVTAERALASTQIKRITDTEIIRDRLEYFLLSHGVVTKDLENIMMDFYYHRKFLYWHCFRVAFSLKQIWNVNYQPVNTRILIKSAMLHHIGSLNEPRNMKIKISKNKPIKQFNALYSDTLQIVDGIDLFDGPKVLSVLKIFQEQLFFGLDDYMEEAAINITKIDDEEIKNLCVCLLLADYLDYQGTKSRRELKERYQCLAKIFPEYYHLLTALLYSSYYRK